MIIDGNKEDYKELNDEYDIVTSFNYLGSIINCENNCNEELRKRIAIAKKTVINMNHLWKNKHLSLKLKKTINGCEYYFDRNLWIRKLDIEEERRKENQQLRNVDVQKNTGYQLARKEDKPLGNGEDEIERTRIIKEDDEKKIDLLWPYRTRDGNSLEKLILEGKVEGKRMQGRPRARWIDGMKKWMDLDMKKMKELTGDRRKWRNDVWSKTSKFN